MMNRKRVLLVFGPIAAVMVWLVARVTMSQTEPDGPVMIPATQKDVDRIAHRVDAAENGLKRIEKTVSENWKAMEALIVAQKKSAVDSRVQTLEVQFAAIEGAMQGTSQALDTSLKGVEELQKNAVKREDLAPFERSQQTLGSEMESLSSRVEAVEKSATEFDQESATSESLLKELRDSVEDLKSRLKSREAAAKSMEAQLTMIAEDAAASREILRSVLGSGIMSGLEVFAVQGSSGLLAVTAGSALTTSGKILKIPREIVLKVEDGTTADRNVFVVLPDSGEARLIRSASLPTDVVVLGKIIRAADGTSVDVSVRSRTIQMAPQTAAK